MKLIINVAKQLLSFVSALCILVSVTSCEDSLSDIGASTMPNSDEIKIEADTLRCAVATGYRDSIYVRTGYPLLGFYHGGKDTHYLTQCQIFVKKIMRRIQRIPEVTECYNTSGAYDYLLKVRAHDMKQYQEFVLNKLGDIDSVGSIESTFVMSEVKQNYGINI